MTTKTETIEGTVAEYVTAVIGGQLFGLPISRVQDVFMPERLTRVPLSSAEIAGVLNLRGRIVTVVDMRARLGLPKNDDGKPPMAVGVDLRGESYGLLIDQIGEVLRLPTTAARKTPSISIPAWPSSPAGSPSRRPAHGRPRRRSRSRNRAGHDGGMKTEHGTESIPVGIWYYWRLK
jgi:purine-binding chemotaxis protein CheW